MNSSNKNRDKLVRVLVTEVRGSSSVAVGAKAYFNAEGDYLSGWIGGGCLFESIKKHVQQSIKQQRSIKALINMNDPILSDGIDCGGEVEIFAEFLRRQQEHVFEGKGNEPDKIMDCCLESLHMSPVRMRIAYPHASLSNESAGQNIEMLSIPCGERSDSRIQFLGMLNESLTLCRQEKEKWACRLANIDKVFSANIFFAVSEFIQNPLLQIAKIMNWEMIALPKEKITDDSFVKGVLQNINSLENPQVVLANFSRWDEKWLQAFRRVQCRSEGNQYSARNFSVPIHWVASAHRVQNFMTQEVPAESENMLNICAPAGMAFKAKEPVLLSWSLAGGILHASTR